MNHTDSLHVANCFSKLLDYSADRATLYVSARKTVRVVKVKKQNGHRFVVSVGPPNYKERANLAKWRKEGTSLESIEVCLYFNPKPRKRKC